MRECTAENDMEYSVLMTVHSGADPECFSKAVESMTEQTVRPEQLVISADGDLTDGLEEIISDYKNQYPNMLTVLYNKKAGNWHAANKGLAACRNEYIARMDSDDISVAERCEKQLTLLKTSKAELIGSFAGEFINDTKNIISIRKLPTKHEDIVKYAKRRNPFNHPSLMFRKSVAIKCGGYKKMNRCEDYDFVVRMIMAGARCANIPECLLYYRLTEDTYSRRKNWSNTKGFIYVRFLNWRRGFSTFWDFSLLAVLQIMLYIMPVGITKWFYQIVLRKES